MLLRKKGLGYLIQGNNIGLFDGAQAHLPVKQSDGSCGALAGSGLDIEPAFKRFEPFLDVEKSKAVVRFFIAVKLFEAVWIESAPIVLHANDQGIILFVKGDLYGAGPRVFQGVVDQLTGKLKKKTEKPSVQGGHFAGLYDFDVIAVELSMPFGEFPQGGGQSEVIEQGRDQFAHEVSAFSDALIEQCADAINLLTQVVQFFLFSDAGTDSAESNIGKRKGLDNRVMNMGGDAVALFFLQVGQPVGQPSQPVLIVLCPGF
jgi:hypothetical protein